MDPEALAMLVRHARKRPLWAPGGTTRPVALGRRDVERILPHRDPFLFVDAITAVDLDQAALQGRRTIRADDSTAICAGQLLTGRDDGADAAAPTICALAVMEVYFVD